METNKEVVLGIGIRPKLAGFYHSSGKRTHSDGIVTRWGAASADAVGGDVGIPEWSPG
jgi:hypothetical protein